MVSNVLDLLEVLFAVGIGMLELLIDLGFHLLGRGLAAFSLLAATLLDLLDVLAEALAALLLALTALFLGQIDIALALFLEVCELSLVNGAFLFLGKATALLHDPGGNCPAPVEQDLLPLLLSSLELLSNRLSREIIGVIVCGVSLQALLDLRGGLVASRGPTVRGPLLGRVEGVQVHDLESDRVGRGLLFLEEYCRLVAAC
jgi:hypothetical protein